MVWLWTILCIAAILWLLIDPFRRGAREAVWLDSRSRTHALRDLREEKARLLVALRELDFDYETAKLSATDYKTLRAKYEARAVEVLKELETTEEKWQSVQEEIDRRLAEKLGPSLSVAHATEGIGTCPTCQANAGAADRFCGTCGGALESICSSCGATLTPGQRFCGHCGGQAKAEAHA